MVGCEVLEGSGREPGGWAGVKGDAGEPGARGGSGGALV